MTRTPVITLMKVGSTVSWAIWLVVEHGLYAAHFERSLEIPEEGDPEEITVRKTRKLRTILGRGQPIVQIDRAQAKAQMADPAALTRAWVDNLDCSAPRLSRT